MPRRHLPVELAVILQDATEEAKDIILDELENAYRPLKNKDWRQLTAGQRRDFVAAALHLREKGTQLDLLAGVDLLAWAKGAHALCYGGPHRAFVEGVQDELTGAPERPYNKGSYVVAYQDGRKAGKQ